MLIPVGTVLLEEVAFRGVLWGLLRRAYGTATATIVSSLLFGLWHALPSLGLASDNQAITQTIGTGRSAQVVTVLGTMAFTAGAGVVFCELRRRSGSLLAPGRPALGGERAQRAGVRCRMGVGHPVTADASDVVAPPSKPRWWTFPRTKRYLTGFPPAGLTGALFFYCLSLTPSLLPRAWYLQAVMSAVTAAIGYGVGLFLGWVARSMIPWRPSTTVRRGARWALAVAAVVLIPLFGVLGAEWQHQIREIVDASQPNEANYILVVVVTLLLTALLILVARGIRALVRLIARLVGRFVPHRALAAGTVLVICVLLVLLATGLLSRGALSAANSVFGGVDSGTPAGVTQPTTPERSGGSDSLVPWNTLGRQGRTFVAGGPTAAMISQFTGQPALEPIRAYAGLESAPSIEAEAALVVRELDHQGAFNRKVLVVATTTGTGWVNPAMIDPLEYMYGGDTATAAIQYSFLPSWISFIADKAPAQEAGRDLFNAVYAKWIQLPACSPAEARRAGREPRVVRR